MEEAKLKISSFQEASTKRLLTTGACNFFVSSNPRKLQAPTVGMLSLQNLEEVYCFYLLKILE